MLNEPIPIGAVRKGDIEHLGVAQGLLHPRPHLVVIILGFDNRQRQVRLVKQNVVRPISCPALHRLPAHMDFPQCEFFKELRMFPPRHILNGWRDELRANIAF